MPRKLALVSAAANGATTTRGRVKGAALKKAAAVDTYCDSNGHVDVPACPICCEPRDSTDMEFYPCPCGFQLCLFCYKRLQNEFSGQCPACRAPYTLDPDDCKRIIASRASETSKSSASSGNSMTQAPFDGPREPSYSQLYSPSDALRLQPPPPPPPPKPEGQGHRKPPEVHRQSDSSPFTIQCTDSFSGLPSGATWATPHLSRSGTQELEVSTDAKVDDTAWPALSETLPTPSTTPVRQNSITGHELSRKLSSATISAFEPRHVLDSTSVSLQQQNSDPPTQPRFHTAQVTSMVSGIKRAVCVPLELPANSSIEPVPEAAAVLPNVKAAVREGRLSSSAGAHQLVTILRQNEKNSRPSLLQAGRLPPGFADPAYRPQQQSMTDDIKHTVHLQLGRLGGTVVDYPSDRSTLNSPFQHTATSYNSVHNHALASPAGTSSTQVGSFVEENVAPAGRSLWQSNGLPGLDLSSTLHAAVPFNVSAIWGVGQDLLEGTSGPSTTILQEHAKPPPPGFGPLLHTNKPAGSMNGYHPPLVTGHEQARPRLNGQSVATHGSFSSRYAPPGIGVVGLIRPAAPPPYRPLDFQPCMKSDFPRAPGTKT